MRGDPPRLPARPAMTASSSGSPGATGPAGAAEELRPLPGDPSARRRDEAGSRRSALATRLMGVVTRHLLDEAEEERVGGDAAQGSGQTASASGSASGAEGGRPAARIGGGGGKGRAPAKTVSGPVVRRAGSSTRRPAAPEDDVWAQGVEATDGTGRIVAPESRIQPARSTARIEGIRPEAADRVGRSPGMRIASWGAVLAAVAALVVMIAAGWLDLAPSDPSGAPAGGPAGEGATPRESTAGR